MKEINSATELINICESEGKSLSEVVIDYEAKRINKQKNEVIEDMHQIIKIMEASIEAGKKRTGKTLGGLIESEVKCLLVALEQNNTISGRFITTVMVDAISVASYNAAMGKIVAAPTAGASGILPAAVLNVRNELNLNMDETINSMFVANGIGLVIKNKATVSGAEGGCQAECGVAAAMAAGAIANFKQKDSHVIFNAAALALKNSLGLTCDPVAGLVEVPCVKRNAFFAVHAILAADLALCGIKSVIPFDEVIDAMKDTGKRLPSQLKETSEGGLAVTCTAKKIKKQLEEKWTKK